MKSKLQLIEECIEEKTKEYHRAVAHLQDLLSDSSSSSFANANIIVAKFQVQQTVDRTKRELEILLTERIQLLGDITEQEAILGSKGEVLKCLLDLPDGLYRLMKVTEGEGHGKG